MRFKARRRTHERGGDIRRLRILEEKDSEEQRKDVATYASRVCTIALVAGRPFASDFAVNVTGEKTFVSAASKTPDRSSAQWGRRD